MAWVWLAFCAFFSMVLETVLGNHGVAVPVVHVVAFYLVVAFGWQRALVPMALAGTLLDVVLGRTFPCSLLALPVVMVLALFWRRQGDCRHRLVQAIPGGLVGLISGSAVIACERVLTAQLNGPLVLGLVGLLLRVSVGGAVALPVLAWVLDAAGRRLAVGGYSHAQDT
ncbi:MAG: hypothetical protein A3K18_30380 [Lentisphaerae bacterium RIFOXYA12_64_32]|nr:MAG: hypothetical protein A3K18_30380 [Lentisphaerae bacterium RIFOXYA12_64_32]